LAACNSQAITQTIAPSPSAIPTATTRPLPVIQFLPADQTWRERQAEEDGFTLGVGIYAINKDIVFLLGGLRVPAGTSQSTLLRSEDGGEHWVEVMKPIPANNILQVEFMDDGIGWALAMWTVEGAGDITLYHTTDYGETWQEWANVPKRQWYGYPIKMSFSDKKHGQIDMVYDEGLPDTNRIAYITTVDGGVTWQENGSLTLNAFKSPEDDKGDYFEVVSAYIRKNSKDYSQSVGFDGSLWKVDVEESADQIIVRKRVETGNWISTSVLSQKYKYVDGRVIIP
jgi:hypothetical protein